MDPIDNPQHYKYGIFYYNEADLRTVVPKRSRALGWSLNFAKWQSYAWLVFVAVVAVVIVVVVKG